MLNHLSKINNIQDLYTLSIEFHLDYENYRQSIFIEINIT